MNRAKLILLACPSILASMLLLAPVYATEVVAQPTDTDTKLSEQAPPIFEVVFEPTPEAAQLEFTDKEAKDAIERYGCDCSSCLNGIRLLQGQLPLP